MPAWPTWRAVLRRHGIEGVLRCASPTGSSHRTAAANDVRPRFVVWIMRNAWALIGPKNATQQITADTHRDEALYMMCPFPSWLAVGVLEDLANQLVDGHAALAAGDVRVTVRIGDQGFSDRLADRAVVLEDEHPLGVLAD